MNPFSRLFKGKTKQNLSPLMIEEFKKLGIKTELDARLYLRIEEQEKLKEKLSSKLETDPAKLVEQIQDRVDTVYMILRSTAFPWLVAHHKLSMSQLLDCVRLIDRWYLGTTDYIDYVRLEIEKYPSTHDPQALKNSIDDIDHVRQEVKKYFSSDPNYSTFLVSFASLVEKMKQSKVQASIIPIELNNKVHKLKYTVYLHFITPCLTLMDMGWVTSDMSVPEPIIITPMPMQQPYGSGPPAWPSNLFGQQQPKGEGQ